MKLNPYIIRFLKWFPHQEFALLSLLLFVLGLVLGRALMSVGMILLFGNAFINLNVKKYWQIFIQNKVLLLHSVLFFVLALSFFWSDDKKYFFNQLQLNLPFAVLPFAFCSLNWPKKYFQIVFIFFILCIFYASGWSLIQYIQNKEYWDLAYGFSKTIPTYFKNDHIRFGMAVVMAIVICFYFFKTEKNLFAKWASFSLIIFFIIYLHILVSKTALISLYLFLLYQVILLFKNNKKLGLLVLCVIALTPVLMYNFSTTFKHKISYIQYTLVELRNKNLQMNISDEGRIISYQTAWKCIKENFLFGVGLGDTQKAMSQKYDEEKIVSDKNLMPHNQFLYIFLSGGLIAFLYFLLMVYKTYHLFNHKRILLTSFLIVMIMPLLVEAFFATQYGIGIYLIFLLMFYRFELINLNFIDDLN